MKSAEELKIFNFILLYRVDIQENSREWNAKLNFL